MCSPCPPKKSILSQLKELVSQIEDNPCPTCCSPCPSCRQYVNSPLGPVIEIYDPLPKPCLPICQPIIKEGCGPQGCCPPCGYTPVPCPVTPATCCPAPPGCPPCPLVPYPTPACPCPPKC
nr:unnamed protein product [Callosobruchus analis]